jgi:hypothetical protein
MQNANNLLDALIAKLSLKNDSALAKTLKVAPPVLSKLRHGKLPVGATILCKASEATDLNVRQLRELMGAV